MIPYPAQIFCDGGVIGPNPSPIGGTWAWCWVHDDVMIKHEYGVVEPCDLGLTKITNNHTELLAAVRALESLT